MRAQTWMKGFLVALMVLMCVSQGVLGLRASGVLAVRSLTRRMCVEPARNWHKDAAITSASNGVIKEFKNYSKKSKKEGVVVLDGHRMVLDAIEVARLVPRLILVSEDAFDAPLGGDMLLALRDDAFVENIRLIHPDLMKAVSDTKSPQGVLGVFEKPQHAPTLSEDAQVLVLDRVMDPGNVGTLVRTAYGLGWDAVMAVECADPFGSKAVRSSMGACLLMPVLECSWGPGGVVGSGVGVGAIIGDRPVFMAELNGASNPHFEADLSGACALVIGSETTGIGDDARTALSVPQSIHVPLARDLESLNAAVAGAIIMGEASRQRIAPSS